MSIRSYFAAPPAMVRNRSANAAIEYRLQKNSVSIAFTRAPKLAGIAVLAMLGLVNESALAQSPPNPASAAPSQAQAQGSSSIMGAVKDVHGRPIAGIQITLAGQNNTVNRSAAADANGAFAFTNLPAGTYQVKVNVAGLAPFASTLTLGAGERRELPPITIRVRTKTTTVQVTATLNDVARAQVKEEEKQRILGILPNYYTSYIWNPAPLTPKLKYHLAIRTLLDPVSLVVVGGIAGAEQWHKTFPGYGQGAEGYAKRFGSTYADTVASRMFGSVIYPTLLHQDPRYFYKGSGSTGSRLAHAIVATVVCRGDDGRLEPNYSHILGSFTAAGISNLYKAPQDRQVGLTFRNGLVITASAAVVNVMREFLFRKLTPNVPAFANGKP